MAHHLAEEDVNFLEMTRTEDHPVDYLDHEDINEFSDPLVFLIAQEEALARAKPMVLRNERPQFHRSKV